MSSYDCSSLSCKLFSILCQEDQASSISPAQRLFSYSSQTPPAPWSRPMSPELCPAGPSQSFCIVGLSSTCHRQIPGPRAVPRLDLAGRACWLAGHGDETYTTSKMGVAGVGAMVTTPARWWSGRGRSPHPMRPPL